MDIEELKTHPAYLKLHAKEQEAIDQRLATWFLDVPLVASTTGSVQHLEAEDLRYWLDSTNLRPWSMISINDVATQELSNELFGRILELAESKLTDEKRGELVLIAREMARALVASETSRKNDGFVRQEHLAAVSYRIDRAQQHFKRWDYNHLHRIMRDIGLSHLAEQIEQFRRSQRGIHGILARLGEKIETKVFDVVQAGLFIATGAPEHEGMFQNGQWSNWTKDYQVRPKSFLYPQSEAEIAQAIHDSSTLRVVGSGHSFNAGPISTECMISLDAYDQILSLDEDRKVVRVQAGIRLRDLNRALWDRGLGLPVLGSTDAQSLGGLIATDLHGTGQKYGFLSEQIRSLRVIDARGLSRIVQDGDDLFHAAIGSIGTCGVVSEVELELVDRYHIEKHTEMVERFEFEAGLEEMLETSEHVSAYYVGGPGQDQVVRVHRWNRSSKAPTPNWEAKRLREELTDFSISAFAPGIAQLLASIDADSLISDTLAPDKAIVMPGPYAFGRSLFYRHDEIEYGVEISRYQRCLSEVIELLDAENFFSIVELRFTPNTSKALLGPGVGRQTAYIGLATPLSQPNDEVFARVESIMRSHGGQPHLGKKTNLLAHEMLEIYGDRFADFAAIRAQQDPNGKFLNAFCERVFKRA